MKFKSFVVIGRGAFPLDMLRYDRCWPESSNDVAMMDSIDPRERRAVRLTTCSPSAPTDARWESFMWKIDHGATQGRN